MSPQMYQQSLFNPFFVYEKYLGWEEHDEDNESIQAKIIVCDANMGYNIFRTGVNFYHLRWEAMKEDAIEWAVDYSRKEIAQHELGEEIGR